MAKVLNAHEAVPMCASGEPLVSRYGPHLRAVDGAVRQVALGRHGRQGPTARDRSIRCFSVNKL